TSRGRAARRLSTDAGARDQADAGEADAGAQGERPGVIDVEDRQGVRREQEEKRQESITRLVGEALEGTCARGLPRARTSRRGRVEGEHPSFSWSHHRLVEAPQLGYAPSEDR